MYKIVTVFLSIFAFLMGGCDKLRDAEFNPLIDLGQHFTIYGYLDVNKDMVYVRVIPFRNTLVSNNETDRTIDAQVTLKNVTANVTYNLRDSVITASTGKIYHVFYTPLRASEGHKYRLEVKNSKGQISHAETVAPKEPKLTRYPVGFTFASGGSKLYYTDLRWTDIKDKPVEVNVWYRFYLLPNNQFRDIRLSYDTLYANVGALQNDLWGLRVGITRDLYKIQELHGFNPLLLPIMGMGVELKLRDDKWKVPNNVWDPNVLVEPAVLDNIENGFGFFGVLGEFHYEWTLDGQALSKIENKPFLKK